MAPRKAPSKAASAGESGTTKRRSPSVTTAPKRITRSRRTRQKSISPVENILESDLVVQRDAERESPAKAVPDEAITSETSQIANTELDNPNGQSSVAGVSPEVPKQSTNPDIAPPASPSGSPATSSSGKDNPIKEKNVEVDANVVAGDVSTPDESMKEPVSKKRKVDVKPTPRVVPRKARSKWDNPDEMLTNPHAPLVNAKLRDLLCNPKAWDILTREEAERILAKFPDDTEILNPGTPNARPDITALLNNDNFRHDVVRYQEGLAKGFHDLEWIQQAQAAHRSRQLGFYDEFMAADFEEKWEMPMPQQPKSEPFFDKNDINRADRASPGSTKGPPVETEPNIPREDAVADVMMNQDTDGQPKPETIGTQHENPIEDRKAAVEDTKDDKAVPIDTSKDEGEKNDQPPDSDIEQEQAQAEAAPTQDPTELGKQEPEGSNNDTVATTLPSLPDMMEGVESQQEKGVIQKETQQPDDVAEVKKPQDRTIQKAVEPAPIAADSAEKPKDENPSDQTSKTAEAPKTKRTKTRAAPRRTQPARKKKESGKAPST